MKQVKKLTVIALLIPLSTACSSPPSESIVEGLIIAQYKQGDQIVSEMQAMIKHQ
ncbi:hypothetical protein [Psychrobacter alimentarius]|uniref:hypothetical protein n=1 Tax=Psychrobacter alimentarius TaxID=261164 RepID=UPI003FD15E66